MNFGEDEKRKVREKEKLHEHEVKYSLSNSIVKKKILALIDWIRNKWYSSKGLFNKRNAWYNYHEGHAAGVGFLLIDFYFRLESGVFLILFVSGILKVWKEDIGKSDCGKPSYFMREIGHNLHYYIMFGAFAAFLWTSVYGAMAPSVESGLMATVISAVLGL